MYYILAILVVCIIGVIILLTRQLKNNTSDKSEMIRILIRQASRWAMASKQDTEIMIAVLHANYGAGYLWAVRDIATDNEIEEAAGINILQFRDEIIKIQDTVTRRLAKSCPSYLPNDSYITRIATTI
jgi:hypothetical protein